MLVTSAVLGGISIKKGYAGLLSLSLFGAGIFMALFGLRENVVFIGAAGFQMCIRDREMHRDLQSNRIH